MPETIELKVTPETKKFIKRFERSVSKQKFNREMLKFFDKQAALAAGHISRSKLSGQRLKRRTGRLAASVVGRSAMVRRAPAMRVGILRGPALRYAGPQEYGTQGENPDSPYPTIRPRNAKALAIPQKPALTPAGVDRFGGPRGAPFRLTFIPFTSSGVAVGGLFDPSTITPSGGLRAAKMYYMLVKKVDLKPTWYLRDGFTEYLPRVAEALLAFLPKALALAKEGRL